MNPLPRIDMTNLPDSAHARELRRGQVRLRFEPALEQEYLSRRLEEVHLRVRTFAMLTFLLGLAFSFEKLVRDGGFSATVAVHFGLVLPLTAMIVIIVTSRLYRHVYFQAMGIIAPVLAGLVAILAAESISSGSPEDLALPVLMMPAVFLFMGLVFRTALVTAVVALGAFLVASALYPLPDTVLLKGVILLASAGTLAALISYDIELLLRRSFLEEALIGELLERDPLTGLKNRRALDSHLATLWQQCAREGSALGLLFVDIDHFKPYNDQYGHQAGDTALRRVAQVMKQHAKRPLDMVARYGGEEFCVLLYDASPAGVEEQAELLRADIEHTRLGSDEDDNDDPAGSGSVTVSIGAAVVQPLTHRSPAGALQLADEALYRAKESGRNRVVVLGAEEYADLDTGIYGSAGRSGPHPQ